MKSHWHFGLDLKGEFTAQKLANVTIQSIVKHVVSEAAHHQDASSNTNVLTPNDDLSGDMAQVASEEDEKDCGEQRGW